MRLINRKPLHCPALKLELLTQLDSSAASGIVHHQGRLYVVADDSLDLLCTDLDGANAVSIPLSEGATGQLPKHLKPDFEALLLCGAELVAIGSGSTPARRRAIAFDPVTRSRRTIDLRPLYQALDLQLHELNIEGAVISGDDVFLAQRGNGARRENALVRLDRPRFEQDLAAGALTANCFRELVPVALGDLHGVPLSLTDLALGPRGVLLFTAAAEATLNPYDDGVVAGSLIGVVDRRGHVAPQPRVIAAGEKLEGLCWLESGELRLVSDPDDPHARAPLFRLTWP